MYGASELRMGGALANPDDMIWYDDTDNIGIADIIDDTDTIDPSLKLGIGRARPYP